MRMTGIGTSGMWQYMGAGKASNTSYLNALAQAQRKRAGSSTGNMTGINNRYGNTYQNTTSVLESLQKAASGIREHTERLSESGSASLFAKAEETGNTKDVVKEVEAFVADYNSMVSNMRKTGGTTNNIYRSKLSYDIIGDREELKNIGITANKDGTLEVDKKKLQNAAVEDLQKVFEGASSFAGKTSVNSIYVESGAVTTMAQSSYQAALGGYNSYGAYNGFGGYGSLGGYGMYGGGFGSYGGSSAYSALLGRYFNSFM